ncbi:hypothetical protein J43TS9_18700 [Paenibacillus cineris]|nr:hypothetical protein J43TS9_18700 [Paenibacillus cineris]
MLVDMLVMIVHVVVMVIVHLVVMMIVHMIVAVVMSMILFVTVVVTMFMAMAVAVGMHYIMLEMNFAGTFLSQMFLMGMDLYVMMILMRMDLPLLMRFLQMHVKFGRGDPVLVHLAPLQRIFFFDV